MSDDYTNVRVFVFTDSLENRELLFKTEYGSLVTETMLKEHVLQQFEKASRHLQKYGKQLIRITIDVLDVEEEQG